MGEGGFKTPLVPLYPILPEEEFEDTKGVVRIHNSKKDRQHNGGKRKSTKGQTTIYKTYT